MERTDVIVVGGGPAGSTTASAVCQLGLRAIVLEKDVFPRFHIGESLLPQSLKVFDRIGVTEKLERTFIRKYGARFVCGETARTTQYDFVEAFDGSVDHAFQVPRADFDQLLLEHAAEQGADVRHQHEVLGAIQDAGRVTGVRVRDGERVYEVLAPIVVDASGRDTLFASGSKARTKHRLPGLDKTALFGHFHGVPRRPGREEGHIDIVTFPHGWFWNIPFRGAVNSTGAVVSSEWMRQRKPGESLDAFFVRTVETAPWMRELLKDSERIASCRALADFSYRVDRLSGDGWLMVGDSSGFIDPLFSTGVHLAFSSGVLAADAIAKILSSRLPVADDFIEYEDTVRRGAELFIGAVQAFYAGPLRERVFEGDQRKILRQSITSMLAGDVFGDAPWVRFLREHFPAALPSASSEVLPEGASPILH